jgi:post-segregation antitoxin (ccd killing protein)
MWLIGKTVNWAEAGKVTCPTVGRIIGMAKDKVSITLDRDVLAAADADAKAAGLNRSELVEQALRHEHLRIALKSYTTTTVPILNIDDYAQKIYRANRTSGL